MRANRKSGPIDWITVLGYFALCGLLYGLQ